MAGEILPFIGQTTVYVPGTPPAPPPSTEVTFIHLTDFVNGVTSKATVTDPEELALLEVNKIIVVWPETGILGIVDDVGVRPVRILSIDGNEVTFNFDSTGLDTTNLRLLGVVYHPPVP